MNTVLILVIGCIHLVQCNEVPIQRLSVRPPCEQGSPLVNAQCGVNGTKCPDGYYCDINLCCQIPCKNGSPHPTKTCGQTAGFNNCPTGYSCHAHPAGAYFACCRSDGIKEGSCPVVKPGTPGICVELCSGDDGCPEKEKCCSTGCGHVCTKPIPGGEVCPIPDCTPPRPLSCTEPDARVFNGVTCPWCPRIVQCKPHCEEGVPLPNIHCGLREDSHDCPRGYFCYVDPIDRFAVCCREHECPLLKCLNRCEFGFLMDKFGCQTCFCKPRPGCPPVCSIFCPFGNVLDINGCPICKCKTGCRNEILPHPNASCDSVSKSCPFTYVCNIPTSGDDHGVCCPSPCEKGTPLKHVMCGLGGQTCPNGYYCNEDVCCQIPCKRGKPHPTRNCADIPGAKVCPAGYSCLVHPADAYAVCCPHKYGRHLLY